LRAPASGVRAFDLADPICHHCTVSADGPDIPAQASVAVSSTLGGRSHHHSVSRPGPVQSAPAPMLLHDPALPLSLQPEAAPLDPSSGP
ncbi:Hypothetical predicted protein, partial [Pelobates cultripes]